MADDVLRAAGLLEGVNYRKQRAIAGGTIPDFTFLLPRDVELHMDVKFPVDNYLRHLEATTDAERDATCSAFLRDVRNRIKELASRGYADPTTTPGFLLLFIPNESVYAFIQEHDGDARRHALAQGVVLCSPFTLFAVLGVVRQAVDCFLLERASDEILDALAGSRSSGRGSPTTSTSWASSSAPCRAPTTSWRRRGAGSSRSGSTRSTPSVPGEGCPGSTTTTTTARNPGAAGGERLVALTLVTEHAVCRRRFHADALRGPRLTRDDARSGSRLFGPGHPARALCSRRHRDRHPDRGTG